MPDSALIVLIIIVILGLAFDFINGFHDTANAIATSVATRVLSPGQALISHQKLFIGTGSNALEILVLQPADRKKMNTAAFLNGIKKPLTHAS